MSSHAEEHKSHVKLYLVIFVLLGILTALEIYLPDLDISYASKAGGLVALAVAKASMVGYFYMHLNEEKAWLKFIALIPLSAILYAVTLILESTYR